MHHPPRNIFVIRLGKAASHAGNRIRIPANRNREAQTIFKIARFKKTGERLGQTALAGFVKLVHLPDLINRPGKIIAKVYLKRPLYFLLAGPLPGHKDGLGERLGTFDPLRVVVGDLRAAFGLCQGGFKAIKSKTYRANAHSRAVAKAVVRPHTFIVDPAAKAAAIAPARVAPGKGMVNSRVIAAIQQHFNSSQGKNGVIGKITERGEEFKIVMAPMVVKFKARTNNIPNNRPDHAFSFFN